MTILSGDTFTDQIRVFSIQSDPTRVLLVRSGPVQVLSTRSDPIRSDPGFVNGQLNAFGSQKQKGVYLNKSFYLEKLHVSYFEN